MPPPTQQPASTATPMSAIDAAWQRMAAKKMDAKSTAMFQKYAYSDLESYTREVQRVCRNFQDKSWSLQIMQLIEPIHSTLKTWLGYTVAASQSAPVPVAPVLGGIMCVLDITERYTKYHERIAKMLADMGARATILTEYEQDIYRGDQRVHEALVDLYGDLIEFVQRSLRLMLNKKGEVRKTLKVWSLAVFIDFDAKLGSVVDDFSRHLIIFQECTLACDKRRLRDIQSEQREHQAANRKQGVAIWDSLATFKSTVQQGFQTLQSMWTSDHEWQRKCYEQQRQLDIIKQREKLKIRIQSWLEPVNYKFDHDENCRLHLGGTGDWFLSTERYKTWKTMQESDLLWVNGKPGCGKSVLAAQTVVDVEPFKGPNVALAYIYCKGPQNEPRDSLLLLRTLLSQLIYQSNNMEQTLFRINEDISNKQKPVWGTVSATTLNLLQQFQRVYLVVDGLDECSDYSRLAKWLADAVEESFKIVKVIVFSRPHHEHIRIAFISCEEQIEVDTGANEEDINTYIDFNIRDLKRKIKSEEALNAIKQTMIDKAEGMFLWIKLLFGTLQNDINTEQMKNTVNQVPRGLEGTYNRCLDQIWKRQQARVYAFKALLWVLNAKRPLTELEMIEAIAIEPRKSILNRDRLIVEGELAEICGDLLKLNSQKCFGFIHPSLQDFLKTPQETPNEPFQAFCSLQGSAHQIIAEVCLTYLLFDEFKHGPRPTPQESEQFRRENALYGYAVINWAYHTGKAELAQSDDLISDLLVKDEHRRLIMQQHAHLDEEVFSKVSTSTPLHFLALYGITSMAATHPDLSKNVLIFDSRGFSPLDYALQSGSEPMTMLLLKCIGVANYESPQFGKLSPLHCAISEDWPTVVDTLIDQQCDLNTLTSDGVTPLLHAIQFKNTRSALKLIQASADVNISNNDDDTALILAIDGNMAELIIPLLEAGAEVNARGKYGATALHIAARQKAHNVAKILIEHGAEISPIAEGNFNLTPLHYACFSDAADIVKLLGENGASPSETDAFGWTPLLNAAAYNSMNALDMLVDTFGADLHQTDKFGRNCLHITASNGHKSFLEHIWGKTNIPDVDSIDEDSDTPLISAVSEGMTDCAKFLLMKGADANKTNGNGDCPLLLAIRSDNTEVVDLLLKKGANADTADKFGNTALAHAAHYGSSDSIELLFQAGADPEILSRRQSSPLHLACQAGNAVIVKKLLKLYRGLIVNGQNSSGESPLSISAGRGQFEIVSTLLAHGATQKPKNDGNLPVHLAAMGGHVEVLKAILNATIINARGADLRTPLWYAAANGHLSAVKLLTAHEECLLNLPNSSGFTPLNVALNQDYVEISHWLLDNGADAFLASAEGYYPLHQAAILNQMSIVSRLLDSGCNPLESTWDGRTAFLEAVANSNVDIVQIFLDRGFNGIHTMTSLGHTPFMTSVESNNLDMMKLLIQNGADPKQKMESTGHTALHRAAFVGAQEAFDFLIDDGLDPRITDSTGFCVLGAAASHGFTKIVKQLIEIGVELEIEDLTSGQTPLLNAVASMRTEVVDILLKAGANLLHRDRTGRNALDLAQHNSHIKGTIDSRGLPLIERRLEEQLELNVIPSVQYFLGNILDLPPLTNPTTQVARRDQMDGLAACLAYTSELAFEEAACLCLSETLFCDRLPTRDLEVRCFLCSNISTREVFICKTCQFQAICASCLEKLSARDAGSETVAWAISDLKLIETSTQKVRDETQRILKKHGVLVAISVLTLFNSACEWLKKKRQEYRDWNQKHNDMTEFHIHGRPGEEFLNLVEEMTVFLETSGDSNPAESFPRAPRLSIRSIENRFKRLYEYYPPAQERVFFHCFNHSFLKVSDAAWNEAKAQNFVDASTNLLQKEWLQDLQIKITEYQQAIQQSRREIVEDTDDISKLSIPQRMVRDENKRDENLTGDERQLQSSPAQVTSSLDTNGLANLTVQPTVEDLQNAASIRPLRKTQSFPYSSTLSASRRHNTFPTAHTYLGAHEEDINGLLNNLSLSDAENAESTLILREEISPRSSMAKYSRPTEAQSANKKEPEKLEELRVTSEESMGSVMPKELILVLASDRSSDKLQEHTFVLKDLESTNTGESEDITRKITVKYDEHDEEQRNQVLALTLLECMDENLVADWCRSTMAQQNKAN